MPDNQQQESMGQEPVALETDRTPGCPFPVVGLGASAGGLSAFEQFFTNIPPGAENELAFVLIQHLDPTHKSILVDIVQRFTPVTVQTAEDGEVVQAGYAYIIPPNQNLTISNGKLHLEQPATPHGLRLPIDIFFRSLAQEQHELAVGIILSGTGTDGTQGVKSIKEAGGLVIVQSPESADYDGMPRSALATQLADYVLPPDQMPDRLLQFGRLALQPENTGLRITENNQTKSILEEIYHILRARTAHDFSLYKFSMVARRIERRMAVHSIGELNGYLSFLRQNPDEVEGLFNDLLIGVTSFFRNPEAFDELKEKVIPEIIKNSSQQGSVRVWVPGCSTGEEAYSLAILFRECMDELRQAVNVQIFATDIDTQAIAKARAGVYSENIALDLPGKRLERFFLIDDNTYTVIKSIRDMVIFADHNLIENPPFSKLDLISCRNLLIYMSTRLQKKLIPLFHYALHDGGFLFLGSAEGIGTFRDLFTTVNGKWKLYQAVKGDGRRNPSFGFSNPAAVRAAAAPRGDLESRTPKIDGRELVEKFLLDHYTPACVVIDSKFDIRYIHGHTGAYLEPAPGEMSANLLRMVRPGLRLELVALIRKASESKLPARLEALKFKAGLETQRVDLAVYPFGAQESNEEKLLLVVFQESRREDAAPASTPVGDADRKRNAHTLLLEQEAWAKEEYFQAVVEELEAANDELKSNNEEMQATNEELQSANEELETSREEMQSVNEELNTVNTELQSKVDELSRVSNDMKNLLSATGIATLFLDMHLKILRYTPATTRIINLIPGDIGRPVSDIVTNLVYNAMAQDALEVLDTLAVKEVETQTRNGAWYLVRILPYRTSENVIDGVVITFVDISEQKNAQATLAILAKKLQEEREYAESIIATLQEPLLVLNERLEVVSANRSYYNSFQANPEETLGFPFFIIGQKQWEIPELLEQLREIQGSNLSIEGFLVEKKLADGGKRLLRLNARKVIRADGKEHLILLALEEDHHSRLQPDVLDQDIPKGNDQ